MAPILLIFLSLPIIIVVFIMFFIGAQKVQKNRILWGVLGVLSYVITVLVLSLVIVMLTRHLTVGDLGGHEFAFQYSIVAILGTVGVFASILVYKKILVNVPTMTNNGFVFCSECGTQCSDNTAFCNKCGNKLSGG